MHFGLCNSSLRHPLRCCAWALCILILLLTGMTSKAQTFKVLHEFGFGPDGAIPYSGLIRDAKGNLYGTTTIGGSSSACPYGCGTVFKVDATGAETILHSFGKGKDGVSPYGGVIRDAKGNLYGTTQKGGSHGAGTVFKITASGKESVLYNFTGGSDGGFPYAGLMRDSAGNLYGTTFLGGSCGAYYGCGTVFEVDSTNKETVLYSFSGGANDGAFPYAGVIRDSKGNFYGTTFGGGDYHCEPTGCGTVFKLSPLGKEKFVYIFQVTDAFSPYGGLVRDKSGNLYGSTQFGFGTYGTIFKLSPSGQKTTLYTFTQGSGAGYPQGTLIRDTSGNLYGTTYSGGDYYSGVVFKLDTSNTLTTLYSFTGQSDGGSPVGGVVSDGSGNLYGTTTYGGDYFNGTVFELTP